MRLADTEEQEELRRLARRWLEDRMPMSRVREVMQTDDGLDRVAWEEMASLGWQGIAVPEELGGTGLGFRELAVLMEEQGRALLPAPFLSTVVLAAQALLLAGSDEQKREWLPAIVAGKATATVAIPEPAGTGGGVVAVADGGDWVLGGEVPRVVDGHTADLLVVHARTPHGPTLFLVSPGTEGIARRPLEAMDLTRKLAEVRVDRVRAPSGAVLGPPGSAGPVLERLLDLALVALAAEQVGGARRCLEMSVSHATSRVQFGRPIGSFQAVKHACADMLVAVESARSASAAAAAAVDAERDDLRVAAAVAGSWCSEAFVACAGSTIQVHGGIGFTWEHDAHLYLKRAVSSRALFGPPRRHRRRLARHLGLAAVAGPEGVGGA